MSYPIKPSGSWLPTFYDPEIPENERIGRSGNELVLSFLLRLAQKIYTYFLFTSATPDFTANVSAKTRIQWLLKVYGSKVQLQSLDHIPKPLWNNPLFKRVKCPISGTAMRDPVQDPTNHLVFIDRKPFIEYVKKRNISPITNRPLSMRQVNAIPSHLLKQQIDHVLNRYQALLQKIQESK
jgi:hypothetical protein